MVICLERWAGEVGNYTTFQLPTFCETFLPKIIKIHICILELQLKMSGIFFMRQCIWSVLCHCHPIISCFVKMECVTFLILVYPSWHGKDSIEQVLLLLHACFGICFSLHWSIIQTKTLIIQKLHRGYGFCTFVMKLWICKYVYYFIYLNQVSDLEVEIVHLFDWLSWMFSSRK